MARRGSGNLEKIHTAKEQLNLVRNKGGDSWEKYQIRSKGNMIEIKHPNGKKHSPIPSYAKIYRSGKGWRISTKWLKNYYLR